MSQVKQKPSYLVTDELTHAHNEFVSSNLDLICLWAKIFRGYCGIGAVIISLDKHCRIIDIPTFSPEKDIGEFLPKFDWINHHLISFLCDGKITNHFIGADVEIDVPTFDGADFNDDYTIEDDNNELKEATNKIFLEAQVWFAYEEYEKSEELLSKGIRENPLYSRAYSSLAVIRAVQQRLAESVQLNLDALSINPMNFRAIYNLAYALYYGWYEKDARWFFKRSAEYHPDYNGALNGLELTKSIEDTNITERPEA
jgi:tetratricopeptide (TPR) repeat protein